MKSILPIVSVSGDCVELDQGVMTGEANREPPRVEGVQTQYSYFSNIMFISMKRKFFLFLSNSDL